MQGPELFENEMKKYKGFSVIEIKNNLEIFNDNLYFLPKNATEAIKHSAELLAAYGFPYERFRAILFGETPKKFEIELLTSFFFVTFMSLGVVFENTKEMEKNVI